MSDYYCPHCGADLGNQSGFEFNEGYWTCTECGQFLTDPEEESHELRRFEGVGWFCDECGAFLNKQTGFSEWCGFWICTECGHVNNISEDEIFESEEAYRISRSGYNQDDDDDDDDGDDDDDDDDVNFDRRSFASNYDNKQIDPDEERRKEQESRRNNQRRAKEEEYRKSQERRQQEQIRVKEEEHRKKQEQHREKRKRIWRTITRKKQVVGLSSEQCMHMRYEDLVTDLKSKEFYNISVTSIEDLSLDEIANEGTVGQILINGTDSFEATTQFQFNAKIIIVYHVLKTTLPPLVSKKAKRKNAESVVLEFQKAGFCHINKLAIYDLKKGWLIKPDSVEAVSIDGRSDYKKSERFRLDAQVVIRYHTFEKR